MSPNKMTLTVDKAYDNQANEAKNVRPSYAAVNCPQTVRGENDDEGNQTKMFAIESLPATAAYTEVWTEMIESFQRSDYQLEDAANVEKMTDADFVVMATTPTLRQIREIAKPAAPSKPQNCSSSSEMLAASMRYLVSMSRCLRLAQDQGTSTSTA